MKEFLLDERADMVERGLIMAAIVVAAIFLWVSIGQKLAVKLGIVDSVVGDDVTLRLRSRLRLRPGSRLRLRARLRSALTSTLAFASSRSGDMVEGAITFPLMALVALALVNLALAGFASTTANHAAGYGARAGSVAQVDPAGQALTAAQQALASGVGTYNVRVAADTYPGGVVRVEVDWSVPNFYGSLMPLFGASSGPLKGTAVSAFRKEGW